MSLPKVVAAAEVLKGEALANPDVRRELAKQLREAAARTLTARAARGLQADPLAVIAEGKLTIQTKSGELIPFRLNRCQRVLLDRIRATRAAGKPVRIWVLKFRQGGISTLCEAVLYALSAMQRNRNALVIADLKEKAAYLHEMAKRYHEQLQAGQPGLVPALRYSSKKELEFEETGSCMRIATADNVDAPRAFTTQYMHLSEFAFYRDLDGILRAALQAVPDHADTMILGETTANGAGTPAHLEWDKAKRGLSEWQAVFLPWYCMEEYERPAPEEPLEGITFDRSGGEAAFLAEEASLRARMVAWHQAELGEALSPLAVARKLNWRRWAIKNKCEQGRVATFRVEYPGDDEEAWASSGAPYYPAEWFERQRTGVPKRTGYLVPGIELPEFRDVPGGPLQVFEWPSQEDFYVIPVDPNDGGTDEAAMVARNCRTNRNDAEFAATGYDPDQLAAQATLLSQLYGGVRRSMIVPERNGVGAALVAALRRMTGNIWREKVTERGAESTEREGWFTDAVNRPIMFKQLGQELRDGAVGLNGARSILECRRLVDHEGKPEAPVGGQDGLAICNAIASKVRALMPQRLERRRWSEPEVSPQKAPPKNGGVAYRKGGT